MLEKSNMITNKYFQMWKDKKWFYKRGKTPKKLGALWKWLDNFRKSNACVGDLGSQVSTHQHLLVTQSFFWQNHFKNWHLALHRHKWEKSTWYSPMIMNRNMVMVRWCVQKAFPENHYTNQGFAQSIWNHWMLIKIPALFIFSWKVAFLWTAREPPGRKNKCKCWSICSLYAG